MMNEVSNSKGPIVLFYSYAHEDEEFCQELTEHLAALKRTGLIQEWYDRLIKPGEEWGDEISEYLEKAEVILLLISSDFLASQYCYEVEAKRAIERHEEGTASVIPVILRPSKWDITPFAKLQALPKEALAVTEWENRDKAYLNIVEGIFNVVLTQRKKIQTTPVPRGFASPGVIKSETTQLRVFDAAFPDQVVVEDAVALVVLIRMVESEGLKKILRLDAKYEVNEEDVESSGSFELEFPNDESGEPLPIDLTISVDSPEFNPPSQIKKIRVKPDGDSDLRILLLTAKKTGPLFVNVELLDNGSVVAGCIFTANSVVEAIAAPQSQLFSAQVSGERSTKADETLGGPVTARAQAMPIDPDASVTLGVEGRGSFVRSYGRIAATLLIFVSVSFVVYLQFGFMNGGFDAAENTNVSSSDSSEPYSSDNSYLARAETPDESRSEVANIGPIPGDGSNQADSAKSRSGVLAKRSGRSEQKISRTRNLPEFMENANSGAEGPFEYELGDRNSVPTSAKNVPRPATTANSDPEIFPPRSNNGRVTRTSNRAASEREEGSAIANVERIVAAQKKYAAKNGNKFGTLEDLRNENLIDENLAAGRSGNYSYRVTLRGSNRGFDVVATPLNRGRESSIPRIVYSNEKSRIYLNETGKTPSRLFPGRPVDQ